MPASSSSPAPIMRPIRQPALEIGLMSIAVTVIQAGLLNPLSAIWPEFWAAFFAGAGPVTMQHIDSGLSGFIAVLLAFFALILGGPIATGQPTAAETRRLLGRTSELMASFLLPALILVAAACISDPMQCGSLVVIIPQVGIVLFLALILGRYIVFEPELLIAAAEWSRHVVRQRLLTLRLRSQKPTVAVFAVHVGTSVLIGVIGALPFRAELRDMAAAALISGSLALGLATVVTVLATGILSATGRSDRITGWMTLVFFLIGFSVVALLAVGELRVEWSAAVAAPVVVVGLSGALPIARLGWLADWSLRGIARRSAARSLARAYVGHVHTLIDLKPQPFKGEMHKNSVSIRATFCAVRR